MHDLEARLVPLNECPTGDLTYLSKQKAIVADVLKQYPYPSDFQMLLDEMKKQWKQWVNQVPVIGFNSGKCDLNVEYFAKKIAYDKEGECNEDVFVAKKENDYMFSTTSKLKF